jgi:hypothetical protein
MILSYLRNCLSVGRVNMQKSPANRNAFEVSQSRGRSTEVLVWSSFDLRAALTTEMANRFMGIMMLGQVCINDNPLCWIPLSACNHVRMF